MASIPICNLTKYIKFQQRIWDVNPFVKLKLFTGQQVASSFAIEEGPPENKRSLEPDQSTKSDPLGLNYHLTDTCVSHFVRLATTNCIKIKWRKGGQKMSKNLTNPQII